DSNRPGSGVLLGAVRRGVSKLASAGRRTLGICRTTDGLIFLGEMLPCLLIVRHDLRRALERAHRLSMSTLLNVSEAEMFPDWSIIGIELGGGLKMIHGRICLADRLETKPELCPDQKVVRREVSCSLQGRNRFRNSVQVDVTVADRGEHVSAFRRKVRSP